MAENPIKKEDIIDSSVINELIKLVDIFRSDLPAAMKVTTDAIKEVYAALNKLNPATKEDQKAIADLSEQTEKLRIEKEAQLQVDKETLQIRAKLKAEYDAAVKIERDAIKNKEKEIAASKNATGSYNALSEQLKKLINAYKSADAAGRKELTPSIQRLDKELKKLDSDIGRHQRNVGNYVGGLKSLAAGYIGVTAIVTGFFSVLRNGFNITIEFEQAMSEVRAVAQATDAEFKALKDSAVALGGATKFSAKEVAGLQLEYAKLGFTTPEILAVTKATLDLAAATGEDLANSAAIAGSTLRQFGLDGTKMQMVVDTIAQSLNMSALDLDKFQTSMQYVGPVANAVGESLQSATAKLAVLANAGIGAEISGTALRNIFIELQAKGLTFNEAMDKISNSSDKATTAFDLFGKRAGTSALILAENRGQIEQFTEAFQDSAGAAEEMAAIMMDNVKGAAEQLSGAWEGLMIRTNNSNGALKSFLSVLAEVVDAINTKGQPALDNLFDERKIDSFTAKWKFFKDQGIGFWNTLGNAVLTSKKQTQEMADTMYAAGDVVRKQQEEEAKAAAATAAEKQKEEEAAAKAAKAEEDRAVATKKAEEEAKKAAEEERKWTEQRFADIEKRNAKATEDNKAYYANLGGFEKQYADDLAVMGDQRVATEEEIQAKLTQVAQDGTNKRKALDDQTAEDIQLVLEQFATAADAMGSIYEMQMNRELAAAGNNAQKQEQIKKKYFEKNKKVSIANALINGAVGVVRQFADLPFPAALITSILVGAATIAQVAAIASQTYAKGGFTGKGTYRDKTGERVAGVVHEDEFVINKRNTKKYRGLLEAIHRDDPVAMAKAIINKGHYDVHEKTAQMIVSNQDPYTEKMYEMMKETPVIYIDSNGDTVKEYRNGRKQIIKRR